MLVCAGPAQPAMMAPEGVQAWPASQCLHLCLCSGPWEAFLEATVDGTRNVVKAAQAAEVPRLVHISTEVRCWLCCVAPSRPALHMGPCVCVLGAAAWLSDHAVWKATMLQVQQAAAQLLERECC